MKKTVQTIARIDGVQCAAVLDHANNVSTSVLHPPYEDVLVKEIAAQLSGVRDTFISVDESSLDGQFLSFENGYVVLRLTAEHLLLAVATKDTNVAKLGVAMSVAAVKLARLAPAAAKQPTPPPIPVARPRAPEPAAAPAPPAQTGRGSSPSMNTSSSQTNTSGSLNMSMSWTEQPKRNGKRHLIEDAVGIKVMQHVLIRLARLIGRDAATGLMEEELMRIGATPSSVRHAQFADLIKSVAVRIADPKKRETFMIQALGDTRAIT